MGRRRRQWTSIVQQVRQSIFSITVLLTLPMVIALVTMLLSAGQYQAMIRRMDQAAELKPLVENTLAEEMFSVAAGRSNFENSGAEDLIRRVDTVLDALLEDHRTSGHLQLTVARRTMDTLEQYILKIRDGMAQRTPIDQMEQTVDEIRNVGRLVADMLDAFITQEISTASAASSRLTRTVLLFAGTEALLLLLALGYSRYSMNRLTESIRTALSSLEETVRRIAEGDLGDRISGLEVEELQELAEHINHMAERLENLIAETRRNQEHLAKAELRTLQAQINPHFLYNTLDAIVWQAESGQGEEVVRLTRSLSDFFRISLSSGADWIPVSQELKHVSAYLSIQQTRYRDILTYEVESPEGLENVYMLKLLLQPLVENALYHGIKEKRGGGKIRVRVQPEGALLRFLVTDTGRGMKPETLEKLQKTLAEEQPTIQAALEPGFSGFGLRNVNMRIRLYYHKKKGLALRSGPEGTEVSFLIPIRTREEIDHDESVSGRR